MGMDAPKILLVEDEAIVAVDLRERLTALGYQVLPPASSAQSALTAVEKHLPNLILLDIVIKGDMDGIETAHAIRRNHDIPVIYLTAYADSNTLQRAKVTEPFAYLIKPFEERELQVAIEIALYKHSMEQRLRRTQDQLQERVAQLQELIAAREQAEAEIRRLNAGLEARVEKRTRELKEANKDLEAFVYSVSHDLRAPLRAIHGFSEILVRRFAQDADPQAGRYMHNILEAGDQMNRLIEDLLAYARVGRRAVRCQPIDLAALLTRVVEQLSARIEQTKAVIDAPSNWPPLNGDATLVGQILANLLENALTYHGPDNVPRIVVGCSREEDEICISIQDNGIGIADGCQEKIFRVFQRLHGPEDYPGTGIGLAIVKRAAELMKSRIEVESSPGEGSTFRLRIPQPQLEKNGPLLVPSYSERAGRNA